MTRTARQVTIGPKRRISLRRANNLGINLREKNLNYQMITTDAGLASVCEAARQYPALALDTEFVRTRTYYPQLGLLQMYDGETVSLIDPLTIRDWSPFKALLQETRIKKFLHAGSEDLEVFINTFGMMPDPFIDTQILASFTGRPLSCGFATLVESFTGIALDKSESRTDWLARPLSERQCEYAAADVFYLLPIAQQLMVEAQEAGWLEAALDECRLMQARRQDVLAPEEAWREIGQAWQLRPRQLGCLKKLAAWRLRSARERDMAVNFVLREEHLWQVARYLPGSLGELDALGLSGSEIRFHGKTLIALVAEAQAMPENELPAPLVNLVDMPGYRNLFKAMKAAVQTVSESSGLSVELLASRRQINQLLNWHWKLKTRSLQPELISGWRGTLMAETLNEQLTGH